MSQDAKKKVDLLKSQMENRTESNTKYNSSNNNNSKNNSSNNNNNNNSSNSRQGISKIKVLSGLVGIGAIGFGAFILMRYRICNPNQALVRTGLGIKEMSITKKGLQWPLQKIQFVDLVPVNCNFTLHAMSSEMVEFLLPVSFTIGPQDPFQKSEAFQQYVKRIANLDHETFQKTIKAVVHGEMRVLVASMTINDIFQDKQKFREVVTNNIQNELDSYGLFVYNSNIEEMSDYENSNYFESRRQKALAGALNQAKVEVAEAQRFGDEGKARKEGDAARAIASINAQVQSFQNEKRKEIEASNTELQLLITEYNRRQRLASIEATAGVDRKKLELECEIETAREKTREAFFRAENLAQIRVTNQCELVKAENEAAMKKLAADAQLYTEQARATGIKAVLEAQASGVACIMNAVNKDSELFKFYLGLRRNIFPELAKHTANAIQGLKPQIHVWNTNSDASSDIYAPIRNLTQAIPPILDAISSQTNIKLPMINQPTIPTIPTPSTASS
eukprot:TRINITY_DN120_c2_g1_i1.p1 TRINITY_DN120_c2_g1~~TRINITY_DN120_c2_g1_i1.p1  ORF type:complete len:506 (-),score=274.60 TRINITY_DN120_c2_g1_i1:162-1679(-)